MSPNFKKYGLLISAVSLLIINVFLFHADWSARHRGLTLTMLDVGQGEAVFIESPTGTQILIDGGPPRKITSKLMRTMPFYDRSIDALIITNPDQDHIGGFADVLKRYKVTQVFEPGTENSSKTYQNLKREIEHQEIPRVLAQRGMRLHLGGGAVLDVLFPDRDVSGWSTNDGSVVAKLTYGETSVMLMGDATAKTEQIVLQAYSGEALESAVLKVGHHGSRTSTYSSLVGTVAPAYALISAGENNKYGHPHPSVLDTLTEAGVKIFRTDTRGTIIMRSDGKKAEFSFRR